MAEKVAAIDGASGRPAATDAVDNMGSRLREARQRSGLSLREVARQLGVSASFVSQLENGKSQPSVATLYSLTQLLSVSIDELFDVESAKVSSDQQSRAFASSDPAEEHAARAVIGMARTGTTDASPGRRNHSTDEQSRTDGPVSRSWLASPADAWPSTASVTRLSVTQPGERTRLVMDSGVIWDQLARNTGQDLDFMEIVYPPGSSSTSDDRMLRHEGYEFGYLIEGELEVTFGFDVFLLKPGQGLGLDSSIPHLFRNPGTVLARGIWCVHHRH